MEEEKDLIRQEDDLDFETDELSDDNLKVGGSSKPVGIGLVVRRGHLQKSRSLVPCHGSSTMHTRQSGQETLVGVNIGYTAERLLSKRIFRGKTQYLVKWREADESLSTWEPLEKLNCPLLVEAFKEIESNSNVSTGVKKSSGKQFCVQDHPTNSTAGNVQPSHSKTSSAIDQTCSFREPNSESAIGKIEKNSLARKRASKIETAEVIDHKRISAFERCVIIADSRLASIAYMWPGDDNNDVEILTESQLTIDDLPAFIKKHFGVFGQNSLVIIVPGIHNVVELIPHPDCDPSKHEPLLAAAAKSSKGSLSEFTKSLIEQLELVREQLLATFPAGCEVLFLPMMPMLVNKYNRLNFESHVGQSGHLVTSAVMKVGETKVHSKRIQEALNIVNDWIATKLEGDGFPVCDLGAPLYSNSRKGVRELNLASMYNGYNFSTNFCEKLTKLICHFATEAMKGYGGNMPVHMTADEGIVSIEGAMKNTIVAEEKMETKGNLKEISEEGAETKLSKQDGDIEESFKFTKEDEILKVAKKEKELIIQPNEIQEISPTETHTSDFFPAGHQGNVNLNDSLLKKCELTPTAPLLTSENIAGKSKPIIKNLDQSKIRIVRLKTRITPAQSQKSDSMQRSPSKVTVRNLEVAAVENAVPKAAGCQSISTIQNMHTTEPISKTEVDGDLRDQLSNGKSIISPNISVNSKMADLREVLSCGQQKESTIEKKNILLSNTETTLGPNVTCQTQTAGCQSISTLQNMHTMEAISKTQVDGDLRDQLSNGKSIISPNISVNSKMADLRKILSCGQQKESTIEKKNILLSNTETTLGQNVTCHTQTAESIQQLKSDLSADTNSVCSGSVKLQNLDDSEDILAQILPSTPQQEWSDHMDGHCSQSGEGEKNTELDLSPISLTEDGVAFEKERRFRNIIFLGDVRLSAAWKKWRNSDEMRPLYLQAGISGDREIAILDYLKKPSVIKTLQTTGVDSLIVVSLGLRELGQVRTQQVMGKVNLGKKPMKYFRLFPKDRVFQKMHRIQHLLKSKLTKDCEVSFATLLPFDVDLHNVRWMNQYSSDPNQSSKNLGRFQTGAHAHNLIQVINKRCDKLAAKANLPTWDFFSAAIGMEMIGKNIDKIPKGTLASWCRLSGVAADRVLKQCQNLVTVSQNVNYKRAIIDERVFELAFSPISLNEEMNSKDDEMTLSPISASSITLNVLKRDNFSMSPVSERPFDSTSPLLLSPGSLSSFSPSPPPSVSVIKKQKTKQPNKYKANAVKVMKKPEVIDLTVSQSHDVSQSMPLVSDWQFHRENQSNKLIPAHFPPPFVNYDQPLPPGVDIPQEPPVVWTPAGSGHHSPPMKLYPLSRRASALLRNADDNHSALAELRSLHERECQRYLDQPTLHPDYEREFYTFMAKKSSYILSLGGDPRAYDATSEWEKYWSRRMAEIFQDNWVNKKIDVLARLREKDKFKESRKRVHSLSPVHSFRSRERRIARSPPTRSRRRSKSPMVADRNIKMGKHGMRPRRANRRSCSNSPPDRSRQGSSPTRRRNRLSRDSASPSPKHHHRTRFTRSPSPKGEKELAMTVNQCDLRKKLLTSKKVDLRNKLMSERQRDSTEKRHNQEKRNETEGFDTLWQKKTKTGRDVLEVGEDLKIRIPKVNLRESILMSDVSKTIAFSSETEVKSRGNADASRSHTNIRSSSGRPSDRRSVDISHSWDLHHSNSSEREVEFDQAHLSTRYLNHDHSRHSSVKSYPTVIQDVHYPSLNVFQSNIPPALSTQFRAESFESQNPVMDYQHSSQVTQKSDYNSAQKTRSEAMVHKLPQSANLNLSNILDNLLFQAQEAPQNKFDKPILAKSTGILDILRMLMQLNCMNRSSARLQRWYDRVLDLCCDGINPLQMFADRDSLPFLEQICYQLKNAPTQVHLDVFEEVLVKDVHEKLCSLLTDAQVLSIYYSIDLDSLAQQTIGDNVADTIAAINSSLPGVVQLDVVKNIYAAVKKLQDMVTDEVAAVTVQVPKNAAVNTTASHSYFSASLSGSSSDYNHTSQEYNYMLQKSSEHVQQTTGQFQKEQSGQAYFKAYPPASKVDSWTMQQTVPLPRHDPVVENKIRTMSLPERMELFSRFYQLDKAHQEVLSEILQESLKRDKFIGQTIIALMKRSERM